ncbi:cupredoxin domain-containing protein [Rhodococcus kronopolitis]|uniref:Plastocyanin/azurin family copper-binding protein n=1 Tax=Rhodococcus kronopolitis TaxID=1460226 RepID=A0ABV9FLX4_9NOCA
MRAPSMRGLGSAAAIGLLLTSAVVGCAEPDQPAPVPAANPDGDQTVVVSGMTFTPSTVTVRAGRQVTWNFDDRGIAHNVASGAGAPERFASTIMTGGSYSVTFTQPGTYPYTCTLHANMAGVVNVVP